MAPPKANGLSLLVELPGGQVQAISAKADDPGSHILGCLMKPLKEMHHLADDLVALRADGHPLEAQPTLQAQGLKDGARLVLKEPCRATGKHGPFAETVFVTAADFDDQISEVDAGFQWPSKEDREARARELKDQANAELHGEKYAAALDLYTAALGCLRASESDSELAAALFGNRALAWLKLRDWKHARDDAERCLALQPDNAKVRYRLGLAERELGEVARARCAFRAVLEQDVGNKAARAALAALDRPTTPTGAAPVPVPETPPAIRWRTVQLTEGHELPIFSDKWRKADDALASGRPLDAQPAAALRHLLRKQVPVGNFFSTNMMEAVKTAPAGGTNLVVLGMGGAALLCGDMLARGNIARGVVVEHSICLAELCRQAAPRVEVVVAKGQMDNEFAFPQELFWGGGSGSLGEGGSPASAAPAAVCLVCDRISDELLGERLVATLCAARAAAARMLPSSSAIRCIPSRAQLLCAPLEVRTVERAGWDASRVNALRFAAPPQLAELAPPVAASWRCGGCQWRNTPLSTRMCEACQAKRSSSGMRAPKGSAERNSTGWWPLDLDEEQRGSDVCRLCAEEQALWCFDFDHPEAVLLERRKTSRSVVFKANRNGRINAIAVWWRLQGFGNVEVSNRPQFLCQPGDAQLWAGRRQAIHYLGLELAVRQGEEVRFSAALADDAARVEFALESPSLVQRMGLIKAEFPVSSPQVLRELRDRVDLQTHRLAAPISGTELGEGDKLLRLGPFDVAPGALFRSHAWEQLEARLQLHADRPLAGDRPITCVFSRGAFEGTRRWPAPPLAAWATVPYLPRYFQALREQRLARYVERVEGALRKLDRARVLQIGGGALPLLALCAARCGARAWAADIRPELRDLAAEMVRDSGFEMVFDHKGYAPFSFFGNTRRPEDPSVRVLPAQPSTSLVPGAPRLLDGQRAHIVAYVLDDGLLGEDYLETMWDAAERLLEPGGILVPAAVAVLAVPVEWLPLVGGEASASVFHKELCTGYEVQVFPDDVLLPLCRTAQVLWRIDLSARLQHPRIAEGKLTVDARGLLTGIAYWHEPIFNDDGEEADVTDGREALVKIPPYAHVCFLPSPFHALGGEQLAWSLRFENHELRLSVQGIHGDTPAATE